MSQWRRMRRVGGICATLLVSGAIACRKEAVAPRPQTAAENPASASEPVVEGAPSEPVATPVENLSVDEQTGVAIRFGMDPTPDGGVSRPVLSYARGDLAVVSVTVPKAAAGAALVARWYDLDDAQLGEVSATLAGSPPRAALRLAGSERLPLGTFRLDLTIDGSSVGEGNFSVTDSRQTDTQSGS